MISATAHRIGVLLTSISQDQEDEKDEEDGETLYKEHEWQQ